MLRLFVHSSTVEQHKEIKITGTYHSSCERKACCWWKFKHRFLISQCTSISRGQRWEQHKYRTEFSAAIVGYLLGTMMVRKGNHRCRQGLDWGWVLTPFVIIAPFWTINGVGWLQDHVRSLLYDSETRKDPLIGFCFPCCFFHMAPSITFWGGNFWCPVTSEHHRSGVNKTRIIVIGSMIVGTGWFLFTKLWFRELKTSV